MEKLPQEANQELWFFKVIVNLLYAALSGGIVLILMMSQQYNYLMELYTQISENFLLFMKCIFPLLLYLGMLGLRLLCMHLWYWYYWYPKKKKKMKLYVQSQCIIDFVHGELFSCDLTDSEIVPSRESDIQNFAD